MKNARSKSGHFDSSEIRCSVEETNGLDAILIHFIDVFL